MKSGHLYTKGWSCGVSELLCKQAVDFPRFGISWMYTSESDQIPTFRLLPKTDLSSASLFRHCLAHPTRDGGPQGVRADPIRPSGTACKTGDDWSGTDYQW